jgi:hypothetical protein
MVRETAGMVQVPGGETLQEATRWEKM